LQFQLQLLLQLQPWFPRTPLPTHPSLRKRSAYWWPWASRKMPSCTTLCVISAARLRPLSSSCSPS
ncbi:hypothetical protein CPC16_003875, partial [Podila verticillata]